MRYIIFITVIFFVFNIFLYDLHPQEVDLVKLKKKEEERKKKTKKSKHVLTNDNLDTIEVPKKPHAFIKAEKKSEGSDKTNVSLGSDAYGETGEKQKKEYWQREKKKLLDEKNTVEDALNRMQNEFNRLSLEFPAEDIITKRATMKDRMDELTKYIPEYEQRLKKLEEELKALEERARKAGVPPGWLRDVQATPSTSKSRSTSTD